MKSKTVANTFRFSQQQITGINYHYSLISAGAFDEDNVRLLLIYLREFLSNEDNVGALGRANAKLLLEFGDSVAHTVRLKGEWWSVISELVRQFAGQRIGNGHHENVPFVLYNLDDIIDVFEKVLIDTSVLYSPRTVAAVIAREAEDLKICLMSMFHGQIFRPYYDGIANDFYFVDPDGISVRTELDLGHQGTTRELRLNALIPCDGGGTWLQCILRHELSDPSKIDNASYQRTGSPEGCCEPIRAMRRDGDLVLTTVPTGVAPIDVYKVLRARSYDTRPISRRVKLTPITK